VPESATVLMEYHFVSFAVRPIPVGVSFKVQAMVVSLRFFGAELRMWINGKQAEIANAAVGFLKVNLLNKQTNSWRVRLDNTKSGNSVDVYAHVWEGTNQGAMNIFTFGAARGAVGLCSYNTKKADTPALAPSETQFSI